LRCLAKRGEAAGELLDHLVLARAHLVQVDLRWREGDAHDAHGLGLFDDGRGVQQRLGRDAADIETDAAEGRIALDQDHAQAEVGGAEGGGVAAGPAPNTTTWARSSLLGSGVAHLCPQTSGCLQMMCGLREETARLD
jgi:hypothetical protein